jgi:rhodanese-related sulfurtransferase
MSGLVERATKNPAGYLDTTVREVHETLGSVRIVDVREPEEFHGDLGHIEGAELVPLGTVESASSGWDKSQPIVFICRSGNRSGRAAAALKHRGFATTINMLGGMLQWNAERLPVVR